MDKYILQVQCDDRTGLVQKITNVLWQNKQNIISTHEFVEKATNQFFMRAEFTGECYPQYIAGQLENLLPKQAHIAVNAYMPKKVILFASKEYHCPGDLLMRHHFGELNAQILAIVSNHRNLESLAGNFSIPYFYIPAENMNREEHEAEVLRTIEPYQADHLILAKYMRILTPEFVAQYPQRILNIHHSFLPAFIGANPYRQAYERGVKIIGATAHIVSDDLDEGPIIAQDVTHVDHSYSWQEMRRQGREIEKRVLAKAVNLLLEDKVFITGNKTIVFD
ncbi:MAG: formyltetrahydrofolate deformylase [Spirochaetota bacterium]